MTSRAAHRTGAVVAGVVVSVLLVSCGGPGSTSSRGPTTTARPAMTIEYSPGLTEDLYLPPGNGRVPRSSSSPADRGGPPIRPV